MKRVIKSYSFLKTLKLMWDSRIMLYYNNQNGSLISILISRYIFTYTIYTYTFRIRFRYHNIYKTTKLCYRQKKKIIFVIEKCFIKTNGVIYSKRSQYRLIEISVIYQIFNKKNLLKKHFKYEQFLEVCISLLHFFNNYVINIRYTVGILLNV